VRTTLSVEASLPDPEALDRAVSQDVRVDDFFNISEANIAIPNGFGIDHHVRTVLTLIQAACLVGAHPSLNAALCQGRLERAVQLAFSGRTAAAARVTSGSLVGAYENVFLKCRHSLVIGEV
jgi:hypothetical protein